jgi:hypothetical protein
VCAGNSTRCYPNFAPWRGVEYHLERQPVSRGKGQRRSPRGQNERAGTMDRDLWEGLWGRGRGCQDSRPDPQSCSTGSGQAFSDRAWVTLSPRVGTRSGGAAGVPRGPLGKMGISSMRVMFTTRAIATPCRRRQSNRGFSR